MSEQTAGARAAKQQPSGLDQAWEQVRQFQLAFNLPAEDKPVLLSAERSEKRMAWLEEEIEEFKEAATIADQADAMIDVMYFALGTLVEMGVRPQELMDIVQHANMSKLWADGKPHYREDGKVIKPEGWEDPYPKLQAAITRQMD
ncbi:HAD family hydrolase [Paenibacillaceae bacterium]|nr:HAD family hydrolase [Paenibacillaceae bacterium]